MGAFAEIMERLSPEDKPEVEKWLATFSEPPAPALEDQEIPVSWLEKIRALVGRNDVVTLAQFSLGGDSVIGNDGYVTRWGKIFEIGEYPQIKFSLNSDEAREAVRSFVPVKIDLEHVPKNNVFADKLGELREIKLSDDGRTIMGGAAVPKWLNDVLGPTEWKVSTAWMRATKRLAGLALTTEPRIAGAELMAAFSKANQKETSVDEQTAAKIAALETQLKERDTRMAVLEATARQRAAAMTVDTLIAAKRVTPGERDPLVALFTQASIDDEAAGAESLATFSEGQPATRTTALRLTLEARPQYAYVDELLPDSLIDSGAVVAFNKHETTEKDNKPMSDERRATLLGYTPIGQAVMKNGT